MPHPIIALGKTQREPSTKFAQKSARCELFTSKQLLGIGALTGYVPALSLKDAYCILTKYFDGPSAREFVAAALDAFEILPIDESICRIAIASDEPDFEDGLIRASAEVAPVDFIISRDERAFRRSTIKRMSAQEYVDAFCNATEVEL